LESAKSAAIRLRDIGQWNAKIYEYSHTPFEALITDREEWNLA